MTISGGEQWSRLRTIASVDEEITAINEDLSEARTELHTVRQSVATLVRTANLFNLYNVFSRRSLSRMTSNLNERIHQDELLLGKCSRRREQIERSEAAGYPYGMEVLNFLTKELPEQNFYTGISQVAAAVHQPLTVETSGDTAGLEEGYVDDIRMQRLQSPIYACHDIASDVRKVLGEGREVVTGGAGEINRNQALDAAINALRTLQPCVISLRNSSLSDDGHSFTLVLRPDGKVDCIEGWAHQTRSTDLTRGRKRNLNWEKVIDALEALKADPTDRRNDAARSEAYSYLSNAYHSSTHYHEIGRAKLIADWQQKGYLGENQDLPWNETFEPTGIHVVHNGVEYNDVQAGEVAYQDNNGNTWVRSAIKGVNNRGEVKVLPMIERDDSQIEIIATIVPLAHGNKIQERVAANLEEQNQILFTLPTPENLRAAELRRQANLQRANALSEELVGRVVKNNDERVELNEQLFDSLDEIIEVRANQIPEIGEAVDFSALVETLDPFLPDSGLSLRQAAEQLIAEPFSTKLSEEDATLVLRFLSHPALIKETGSLAELRHRLDIAMLNHLVENNALANNPLDDFPADHPARLSPCLDRIISALMNPTMEILQGRQTYSPTEYLQILQRELRRKHNVGTALKVPTEAKIRRAKIDSSHYTQGLSQVAHEIPAANPNVDIRELHQLYLEIRHLVPDQIANDERMVSKELFEQNLLRFINSWAEEGAPTDSDNVAASGELPNKVRNCLRHYILHTQRQKAAIEACSDPNQRERLAEDLAIEMKQVLTEQIGLCPYHCNDRLSKTMDRVYFERIEQGLVPDDTTAPEQIARLLFHWRKGLFEGILTDLCQKVDSKDSASAIYYWEQKLGSQYGISGVAEGRRGHEHFGRELSRASNRRGGAGAEIAHRWKSLYNPRTIVDYIKEHIEEQLNSSDESVRQSGGRLYQLLSDYVGEGFKMDEAPVEEKVKLLDENLTYGSRAFYALALQEMGVISPMS